MLNYTLPRYLITTSEFMENENELDYIIGFENNLEEAKRRADDERRFDDEAFIIIDTTTRKVILVGRTRRRRFQWFEM